MVDLRNVDSWLQGPGGEPADPENYPGQGLGMPERGPGSLARFGRRLVAVLLDWLVCTVIAAGLMHYRLGQGGLGPFKPLAVFVLMNLLLVGTVGFTIGHRLLGIRVVRLDGASAGPLLAVIRTVLLAVVIPAVIWDRDTRGFHDKIAGTVPVRM
jgi:uncharacterized RDD family membrane protein YckC